MQVDGARRSRLSPRAILRLLAGLTTLGLAGCGHVFPIAATFRGRPGSRPTPISGVPWMSACLRWR